MTSRIAGHVHVVAELKLSDADTHPTMISIFSIHTHIKEAQDDLDKLNAENKRLGQDDKVGFYIYQYALRVPVNATET